jgi:hypothetical protein
MNLDADLLRILNVGAKVYHVKDKRKGKVYSNNQIDIIVDFGKGKYDTYKVDEFTELLTSDVIVANSRVTLGNGDSFKIKPREVQPQNDVRITPSGVEVEKFDKEVVRNSLPKSELKDPCLTNRQPAEIGYINFLTGRFSSDPKKGYTKVEFRKAVEKVTLEVDSEGLEKLREMGLLK